jgi:adenylate kinase family enzyme
VRRVSVVGNSGSGKSMLSRAMAARLSFVRVASGADAQRLLDSAPPLK